MADLGAIGQSGGATAGSSGAVAYGGDSALPYAQRVVTMGGLASMLTDVAIAAGAAWPVTSPIGGTLSGAVSSAGSLTGTATQPPTIAAVVTN
jgi:hypothetical protein